MLSNARILVADDDPEVLESVTHALEELGAHVVPARSGHELIALLGEEGPFSLVVTDISMPWMTGLQAMHSARYAGLLTPIIVITGLTDVQVPAQVQSLGHAVVLLRKPFRLDHLVEEAARLLAVPLASGTPGQDRTA
jgi:CheY-like chemotaxis protein